MTELRVGKEQQIACDGSVLAFVKLLGHFLVVEAQKVVE